MNLDADLVSGLATAAVVLLGSTSAVIVTRRVRAARRRDIERIGAGPDAQPEPDRIAKADPSPGTDTGLAPGGAQILPFRRSDAARPSEDRRRPEAPLVAGLARTRAGWVSRLGALFAGRKELDPGLVDEVEKVLLTADIGVKTSLKLMEELRASLSRHELRDADAVWSFLRARCREILSVGAAPLTFQTSQPFVILVIGVNGSGKTTTIGKLAAQLRSKGKSVILAAGDTFRAAAVEQLEAWGKRVDVRVVRGKDNVDPSSVIFDAVRSAKAEGVEVVVADTAGRLHTKSDLMEELQKVRRVTAKAHEGAPHETWLVIDSTSGQNAIAQAQMFTQAMQVTGIVLTKLDGTAKGGVILGIADQLKIPVRYIGVGERVEDLRPFSPEEFVDALFESAGDAASSSAS